MASQQEYIEVEGAKVHNLKNIDVKIPRDKLVVITGLSGSGKSSLAFDTIYAEGQRRYIETFSAYARQFLGGLERPDVDKIDGLSPVISIEQKTTSKNPRSTVGTITEIYDFLRLLYARISYAYSYKTGEKMISYTLDQIKDLILESYHNQKILLLAPVVKARKGHYRELLEHILKQGFIKVRIDGEIQNIMPNMKLDRYKNHDIEIVIDRIQIKGDVEKRLKESLEVALKYGKGIMQVYAPEHEEVRYFSKNLMCPSSGIAYDDPEPNNFSFNSPKGACKACNGLGIEMKIDEQKIFPDKNLSIERGGLAPLADRKSPWIHKQLTLIAKRYNFDLKDPIHSIPPKAMDVILNGSEESFKISNKTLGITQDYKINYEGISNFISYQYHHSDSKSLKRWAKNFMLQKSCSKCSGNRLKKESLHFKIDGKNISELAQLDISELYEFFSRYETLLDDRQKAIGLEIIKELKTRLKFLLDVGLDYLNLNRSSKSLSGGEAQRIRLATQIGSQLVGVLYILDEPSIGLHQKDNTRLIKSLQNLRDIGNSVLVVEHDKEMIECADHVLDIGPGAGRHGGEIVCEGSPEEILKKHTLTTQYLNGEKEINMPKIRREGNGKSIQLKGAEGNNLKNVDLKLPLGKLVCVTGVSGSGKSTLINETLYPILNSHFFRALKKPLPYKSISGLEHIDKVIDIDQSPIGRTPRSNPATYTGVLSEIRKVFSEVPEAKIRAYKPGRFSFNVKGGRCETCEGGGMRVIEMNFLPDVHVKCETCNGKRFNRETLEIRYKGKSISDVLDMTINQAVDFFEPIPKIYRKIKTLQEVGLGYITLGQQSTTLSGGEAQRVKLATELSKRDTGNTLFILDEPTTGLHFEDIRVLMEVLNKLVEKGNTVLIIEHNMDVIKLADHIIDLGPEGGKNGGIILCEGKPEELLTNKKSHTISYLKSEFNML
ncbi:MAG: excinuclease ABC subunit UvrA [Flavobacteriales bacterium]|nr:excinuclease ABC subunit UvrA [Flavobacteriales bacterium]